MLLSEAEGRAGCTGRRAGNLRRPFDALGTSQEKVTFTKIHFSEPDRHAGDEVLGFVDGR
jgi:hypothetical protein